MQFEHKPVLLDECIEGLNIDPKGTYLDGTLGGAGHSSEILRRLEKGGMLVGVDQDAFALETSQKRLLGLQSEAELLFYNNNFEDIKSICEQNNIEKLDGILLDLGVSSYQLDNPERGFSYMKDASLDMRMNENASLTASEVINTYSDSELKNVLWKYGEEKYARRIVDAIVRKREDKKIETTLELVDIIKSAIPGKAKREGQHPAKRTFQAVRIEVNNELGVIPKVINDGIELLNEGGRLCIITFHSLEDRIVKQEFVKLATACTCPREFPVCMCNGKAKGKIITRKPIIPTDGEIEENPRARSAKLRVLKKV
jgi:16S rRNA (cytosine1402-N4)-methyltransferase